MSLINEALKKAQRQRTEDAAVDATAVVPGAAVAKRGQARSAKSVVMLGVAALALVLLSVGVTFFLLGRSKSEPTATVASAQPAPKGEPSATPPTVAPPTTPPPAPKETAPVNVAPTTPVTTSTAPAPTAVEPKSTPPPPQKSTPLPPSPMPAPKSNASVATTTAPAQTPPTNPPPTAPTPAAVTPTPVAPATDIANAPATSVTTAPTANSPARPDERIQAYIDGLRITGALPRGAESRVLMNDRVFRLNEMVERTLEIRLIKVEPGVLTFSDRNAVLYIKYF